MDLPVIETNIKAASKEKNLENIFNALGKRCQDCITACSQDSDR